MVDIEGILKRQRVIYVKLKERPFRWHPLLCWPSVSLDLAKKARNFKWTHVLNLTLYYRIALCLAVALLFSNMLDSVWLVELPYFLYYWAVCLSGAELWTGHHIVAVSDFKIQLELIIGMKLFSLGNPSHKDTYHAVLKTVCDKQIVLLWLSCSAQDCLQLSSGRLQHSPFCHAVLKAVCDSHTVLKMVCDCHAVLKLNPLCDCK